MFRSLLGVTLLFSNCLRSDPPPRQEGPAPVYRLVEDAGPTPPPRSLPCGEEPCTFVGEGALALATDGTTVVIALASGELVALPARGGSGRTLALAQRGMRAVAIADATVFFVREGSRAADWNDGAIVSVPLGGGTVREIAANQQQPAVIAVDRERVYWVNYGGSLARRELRFAYRRGGPSSTIARDTGPHALLAHAGALYVADRAALERFDPLNPEQHSTMVETEMRLVQCALESTTTALFCAVQGRGTGGVLRVPLDGTDPSIVAGGRWGPGSIAIDTQHAYFTDPTDGRLMRVPLGGGDAGAPVEIVRRRVLPDRMIVADGYAFWLEGTNGTTVVRMRLP